ncbi:hypothetical protein AQEC111735_11985 [Aquirufa ecclesiirivi]
MVPVKAAPFTCGEVKLTANLLKLPYPTVTLNRSAPEDVNAPSVATIRADSARYNFMEAVASPLLKVMVVAVPKFTLELVLSLTVGFTIGNKV